MARDSCERRFSRTAHGNHGVSTTLNLLFLPWPAGARATCLPEVYDKAAEFFDGKKVDDIAAAIKRVIDSPKRQAELKKLGKERLEHFSWQESAQALLDGYDKALKAQAKPSGLRLPRIGR